MRTATEANVLEVGGDMSARRSTIKMSKKTFRMHIDGIYSEKIASIVREIAANAFDSHIRAQQDRPFFVHCPNVIEPTFFVRDFGTGMTDQVMGEIYIVLGESDKDMTDDEVGMWGMGSKSPFSYSDQYNITCYDGVEARFYGYGIAEDGVPTLYLMHTEPCDEPRGVKIGFAVETKDFPAFEKAIEFTAIGHNNAFETNLTLPQLGTPVFTGEGWSAYKGMPRSMPTQWYARQGCILYPIEHAEVARPAQNYNDQTTFILDCPIGTIQVTASRESISYTEEVLTFLKARINQTLEEVTEGVWSQVRDIDSVVDFYNKVAEIKPSFINSPFVHPLTGLTSPNLTAAWPTIFHKTAFTNGRWEFSIVPSLSLTTGVPEKVYVLEDYTALLDPSRDPDESLSAGFSKSEQRRIARFTRAYLESLNITSGLFMLGTQEWTPRFWKACLPKADVTRITFDELRKAVPRRLAPVTVETKAPLRGVALAKAAGEQKPVFNIKPPEEGEVFAWVSSEQYRRQASSLFKLAKRLKITALYICAPQAQEQVVEAGIKHMRVELEAYFVTNGTTLAEWYYTSNMIHDYSVKNYVGFLRKLQKADSKSYTRLANGKGELSTVARGIKRLLKFSVAEFADDERKALESLLTDDNGKAYKPDQPVSIKGFTTAVKVLKENYYANLSLKFATNLEQVSNADQLSRAVTAILSLQALFPPTEKMK